MYASTVWEYVSGRDTTHTNTHTEGEMEFLKWDYMFELLA